MECLKVSLAATVFFSEISIIVGMPAALTSALRKNGYERFSDPRIPPNMGAIIIPNPWKVL